MMNLSLAQVKKFGSEIQSLKTKHEKAIQKADDLRPDIPSGASYVLARGPLPERGFVYVIVPDIKLPTFRALTPLAPLPVIVRVRNGRSRYLGNPVVDLVSLEGGTTP